ncbi:SMI1/KNR4 family protein [Corallococcus praedator]|uniref:SMI1/KNR4 family protein n=1 Tax=Corallococcus praedator TaxID=2316724 RepID=A0ABX9Q6E5_9BACT|nr:MULTISPECIES: SMI1/KNR4 family protein [Corallococcus]RKH16774.1 SMI1/KNR4 family protein [Corallococcus sp. CA031C]RKH89559.1 SMI1/KNR4 family protein [Corallococcus praedator]
MHEWLEALRKSAKATSEGVLAEDVRRAETECGIPFPGELTDLYLTLNGGEFEGEVRLYPLRGGEGAASVLEKSRLMLVGLPAAGVWRFGLKGPHRHLFVARKSAMEEQGDGGGPLPGWMEALDADDWVFGTWENEKKEMRLYRTLKDMLEVLVPPVEVESFGERTFARALNAVLQGALSGAAAEEDEAPSPAERNRDYSRDLAALARDVEEAEEDEAADEGDETGASDEEGGALDASEEEDSEVEEASEAEEGAQEELFTESRPSRSTAKKVRPPASREASAVPSVSAGKPSAPKKGRTAPAPSTAARGSTRKSAHVPSDEASSASTGKATAKKGAPARGAAKKATGKAAAAKKAAPARAAKKATGKAAAAKKGAPTRGAAKKATGKAAAKKGAAQKRGGTAAKKGAAAKRSTAKKGAAQKRGGAAAKKSVARKPTAKKSARRRS